MEDNWVSIFSSNKPWQAEIAKQVLFENGIEAVVINKQDSSYTSFGDVEVYVSQDEAEKSKELLKNIEN
ncbi:MAG: DUF2007 domain-containing protein [Bacteroidales bacterium]|nr:DUF2007 domain-containing protein [Bacteroidales bacterium]